MPRTSPAPAGLFALLAVFLLEHRVKHLEDEALPCLGELCDALHVSLELGSRAPLAGLGFFAEELFDGSAEEPGERLQLGEGEAADAGFDGCDLLLRDAEELSELHLGHVLLLAELGDAAADLLGESLLVLGHGVSLGLESGHRLTPDLRNGVDSTTKCGRMLSH